MTIQIDEPAHHFGVYLRRKGSKNSDLEKRDARSN
jgi:hypothetical protein